ncbi:hypothetical protein L596_000683 [Steinernema carpocapsae]|uniref:Uncharacterized protein n=1 Tax=Steinernema carpocapsae TaxID=34508 RepID=A0A4U8UK51_STECR|nr:hypothetical protein L596_000683 [Steinernema carpocapsae]
MTRAKPKTHVISVNHILQATISPRDRFDLICDMIQQSSINDDNRFMQKFGVYVDTTLMITEARVLCLPLPIFKSLFGDMMPEMVDGHTVIRPDTTATWRSREVQSNSRRRAIIAVIINSEVRSSMGNSFFPYFNALMRACRSIGINLVDQQDSFQPVIHTYQQGSAGNRRCRHASMGESLSSVLARHGQL